MKAVTHRSLVTFLCLASLIAKADVRPAALFANHMVIQRATKAPVWGTADAGEEVQVKGSWGASATTTAGADGKWMLRLKTPKKPGPYTITIQGKNSIELKDVLAGEVWVCSGQSNMDFAMQMLARSKPGRTPDEVVPLAEYVKNEMETAEDSQLRQFTVQKTTAPYGPGEALTGEWMVSSPETNPNFSATAYFFGKELRKALELPVAVIECAWGGTRVEAWMPAEAFEGDEDMRAYKEEALNVLRRQMEGRDEAVLKQRHEAAMKRWQDGGKKGRAPKMASNPEAGSAQPSTLYNGMLHPLIPFAIRGVIWYQGESNAKHNTEHYQRNFEAMIQAWRSAWGQGDFPFYFAQLANFQQPVTHPEDSNGWASVCDQQRRSLRLRHTGMAVLNDIGEARDIHPHNKMEVGQRLALWALANDYKKRLPAHSGPLYKDATFKDGKVWIRFDHVGTGLTAAVKPALGVAQPTEDALQHFQICAADRKWKWASAEISGKDTVTVFHPEVAEPVAVRYAWAQNPESANLYNKEGLPASIFTTEAEIPPVAEEPGLKKGRAAAR